jgi:hypothetical protein
MRGGMFGKLISIQMIWARQNATKVGEGRGARPSPEKSAYRNVGKWGSEANMAPKKEPSRRFLISTRSFLRHGKRRASRTNSSTKGHLLITYGQPLIGTENKNKRPPRTRPFCSLGAIAAAASPLFRQPRRPHSENHPVYQMG